MTHDSSRTTGGDPVEGADPGGTHSTRPGKRQGEPKTQQRVESGDRNTRTSSDINPDTRIGTPPDK